MEYYLAVKATKPYHLQHMDGLWKCDAKWNKSEGERQILYDFTHMWDLKNKQNKWRNQTKQTQICRHRDQSSGFQRGGKWGMDEIGKGD